MYRVSGGTADNFGRYLTTIEQKGGLQSQVDLALNPEWGTTATTVSKFKIPAGTKIYSGYAAPQTGIYQGGAPQIYIPEIKPEWRIIE